MAARETEGHHGREGFSCGESWRLHHACDRRSQGLRSDTGHGTGRRVVEVRNGDLDVYRQRVTVQDGQPAPVVGHEFK